MSPSTVSSSGRSRFSLGFIPPLSSDGWLLFATCGVRTFAYGFLSVILGVYLGTLGFDADAVGVIFTAALAGGAMMTVAITGIADRVGRRRMLVVGAVLMALAGATFAVTGSFLLLIFAAIVGTISPSGKEVGPFLSLEQAILPQTAADEHRTSVFAAYNVVGSFASALGSLAVGLPALAGIGEVAGYRALIWAYAAFAILLAALFALLSPAIEPTLHSHPLIPSPSRTPSPRLSSAFRLPSLVGVHRSRRIVLRLAALFAIDSFAGGFVVQGLVAYWFYLRFGLDTTTLGGIFFGANVLTAVSYFAAVPIARRIGLLNTMVFTHLPSNVLLLLVPFMPTMELTVGVLLARHLLSQLDVPTRQSYTMAVVAPDERSAAAGITSVARSSAAAVAPAFAGATLASPALGLPFLVAGGLKIVYDLAIYFTFRGVRPPEEGGPVE